MSNLLEQAQDAAQQENWSLLIQSLQQLLVGASETREQPSNGVSGHSALKQETNPALEPLLNLAIAGLEAGDFQARWDLAKLFAAFGDRAIAPLLNLLTDDEADLEARWFAGSILGEYKHPDVVTALVDLLRTTDHEELSGIIAAALAKIGTPAIVALSERLLQDKTRLFAVRSLAQIRHSETIAPLLTVVADPQPQIRAIALEALSSFHDFRVPPVLVRALTDPAATVRQEAITGLGMRPDLAASMNLIPLLIDRLGDTHLDVCLKAATALGRMKTTPAAEALFHTLHAAPTPIPLRIEIVRALGWMETAIALDYLRQSLFQSDMAALPHPVHQEIVTVLGHWTDALHQPQAAQVLIDLLAVKHPVIADAAVRQAIALGLGHLAQKQALEPLIQLLADPDIGVRLHTVAALKKLDEATARQRLEALSTRNDVAEPLKQGAAIALQEW